MTDLLIKWLIVCVIGFPGVYLLWSVDWKILLGVLLIGWATNLGNKWFPNK